MAAIAIVAGGLAGLESTAPAGVKDLPAIVREIPSTVLKAAGDSDENSPRRMWGTDIRARRQAMNLADVDAWRAVKSREEWEALRDARIAALRRSVGDLTADEAPLKVRTTKTIDGDGFRIENVVFESRRGLLVTANLYSPSPVRDSMPGIVICHAHHTPKAHSELQDMGMNFARAGCLVLVPDQVGHGERRQHPFATDKDYKGSFRVSRQDYYFRFNVGLQLHLVGESLIGWMARDMMRGFDLLLARPGCDKSRLIVMGSVAGGGDPCAVTAALDPRIACAVPFNFGGPQPETTYPLPEDAERAFNYMGGGSWESTRNISGTGPGGYMPWVIVGAVAPRKLVYAHEFTWDRERDPVWKRYQTLYEWYGEPDALSFAHGWGKVTLSSAEASHCTHIGPPHRKMIYPSFEKWFGIRVPEEEYRGRRESSELLCLVGDVAAAVKLTPVCDLARAIAERKSAAARKSLHNATGEATQTALRDAWRKVLGDIDPPEALPAVAVAKEEREGLVVERLTIPVERKVVVPALVLRRAGKSGKLPAVVLVGQRGKQAALAQQADSIARLLDAGIVVCLPDLRGTGETSPGNDRGRGSAATSYSSSELMLGQTLVGSQLKDLRIVLRGLARRDDVDPSRIALWGDSFAPANATHDACAVPLDAEAQPKIGEPMGALVTMLAALFEPNVAAVATRGGLVSWASLLDSPFLAIPHDVLVPNAVAAGELADLAGALAPRPVLAAGLIDGRNVSADNASRDKAWGPAVLAYRAARADAALSLADADPAAWLATRLTSPNAKSSNSASPRSSLAPRPERLLTSAER